MREKESKCRVSRGSLVSTASCLVGIVVPNLKLLDGQCIVDAAKLVDEHAQCFHPFLGLSRNRGNLCQVCEGDA